MARLEKTGDFIVTIGTPRWTESERKGKAMLVAELPCTTENGETITHYAEFSDFLVERKGRGSVPLARLNAETFVALGMPEPFNPANIGELEGKQATVSVALDEWEDKKTGQKKSVYRAKYISALRRPTIDAARAAQLLAAALGEEVPASVPAAAGAGASPTAKMDDLDF